MNENYEARILRLEDSINDLGQSMSALAAQYEFLNQQLSVLPENLSDQLTSFSKVIDDKLSTICKKQDELSQTTEHTGSHNLRVENRISTLEKEAAGRIKRVAFYKKILAAVLTTVGGAIGVKLVEWFMSKGAP